MESFKKEKEEAGKAAEAKPSPVIPARPLSAYTGEFENPIYGRIVIGEKNGSLTLTAGIDQEGQPMIHFDGDRFKFVLGGEETTLCSFSMDASGRASGMSMEALMPGGCGYFARIEKK